MKNNEVALESALYNFVKLGCKIDISSEQIIITRKTAFTQEQQEFVDYMIKEKK